MRVLNGITVFKTKDVALSQLVWQPNRKIPYPFCCWSPASSVTVAIQKNIRLLQTIVPKSPRALTVPTKTLTLFPKSSDQTPSFKKAG